MSLTSPIPVLRGSGGAVLQSEGDDLVLSRADVETRIPLQAVRRIRAEGSAVAVELTAPAGTAPAVHRVDGLSRAAVTVFADAVNAALPERAEEAGETADGSALVTVRALTEPPESEQDRDTRVFRLWLKTVALVTVVLAVAVGITAQAVFGLSVLVVLPVGLALTTGGYMGLKIVWKQWYLPRKGITVVAVRREGATDKFGGTGNFVYVDLHGQSRAMYAQSRAEDIPVAYHPERPGTVAACQSWLRNSVETVLFVALLLLGLAIDALIVGLTVGAFLGLYDDYAYTLG